MANNQNTNSRENEEQNVNSGLKVNDQGQNLGGGKEKEGGQKAGQFADDENFEMQTDQTIAQAQPGQTMTNKNQGGSNA